VIYKKCTKIRQTTIHTVSNHNKVINSLLLATNQFLSQLTNHQYLLLSLLATVVLELSAQDATQQPQTLSLKRSQSLDGFVALYSSQSDSSACYAARTSLESVLFAEQRSGQEVVNKKVAQLN